MSATKSIRKCQTPGCKKPAEENSDYCLACQQEHATNVRHDAIQWGGIGTAIVAVGAILVSVVAAIISKGAVDVDIQA